VGIQTYPVKKKIVEKPPRNSAGICGGGHGLSWAVEPRKEERRRRMYSPRIFIRFGVTFFFIPFLSSSSSSFLFSTFYFQVFHLKTKGLKYTKRYLGGK
jgi:hypothetical protein